MLLRSFVPFPSLGLSGRGVAKREGVQGFARAALAGGIPCLLATKWHVPVRESITLINRIYTSMATHKVRRRSGIYVSQMS